MPDPSPKAWEFHCIPKFGKRDLNGPGAGAFPAFPGRHSQANPKLDLGTLRLDAAVFPGGFSRLSHWMEQEEKPWIDLRRSSGMISQDFPSRHGAAKGRQNRGIVEVGKHRQCYQIQAPARDGAGDLLRGKSGFREWGGFLYPGFSRLSGSADPRECCSLGVPSPGRVPGMGVTVGFLWNPFHTQPSINQKRNARFS